MGQCLCVEESEEINEGLRGQARRGQPNQYERPANTQHRNERQPRGQPRDFSNQQWEGQYNQFGQHPNTQSVSSQHSKHKDFTNQQSKGQYNQFGRQPNTQPVTGQPAQRRDFTNQQSKGQYNQFGRQPNTQPVTGQPAQRREINNPNVLFYQNMLPAFPNNDYINDILHWTGKYDILEKNHSYIQWLFPNRVAGVNAHAYILKDEEVQIIRTTRDLKANVLRAFEMMLDFYGMRLAEENQFELQRNAAARLQALNLKNNHNFRRICRILLALKELGHSHLMVPWLKFLADLIYKDKRLAHADKSFRDFWIDTLDAEDKINLEKYLKSTFPEIFQKK